jgi:hypothetical protein
VIDVRVREYNGINRRGIEWQGPVSLERLRPSPLIQTAVQQNAASVYRHQMHGARNGLRSAEELKSHTG